MRDVFRGGASHFGVSDPAALARDTQLSSNRDISISLIGRTVSEREDLRYIASVSPIAHVESLSVPMIFFQGDEDKVVVPPNQTGDDGGCATQKGAAVVGYSLFSGEQHGFRKAENIKRALDAELYFYAVNVFRGWAF